MKENLNQKKQIHRDFWENPTSSLIFIPTAQMIQYDTQDYKDRFFDPEKMWQAEMERARQVVDWPTDGIPTVRPNLGTIFIPAILGQDIVINDDSMPWPGAHLSGDQILSALNTPLNEAEVFKLAQRFYEIHNGHGTDEICPYLADTQGVFDVLHLLLGDELFYDLADSEDEIKELLSSITRSYITISEMLKQVMNESANEMVHGHGTQQGLFFPHAGVRLAEDTATLLSPGMIDQFVMPYVEAAAEPFGGAFAHFCGKHEYLYEQLVSCDGIKAIDLGNPEMFDTRWLLEKCAETGTVFYGKLAANKDETWQEYIIRLTDIIHDTGAKCVLRPEVFPDNVEDCARMYDFWHQRVSG